MLPADLQRSVVQFLPLTMLQKFQFWSASTVRNWLTDRYAATERTLTAYQATQELVIVPRLTPIAAAAKVLLPHGVLGYHQHLYLPAEHALLLALRDGKRELVDYYAARVSNFQELLDISVEALQFYYRLRFALPFTPHGYAVTTGENPIPLTANSLQEPIIGDTAEIPLILPAQVELTYKITLQEYSILMLDVEGLAKLRNQIFNARCHPDLVSKVILRSMLPRFAALRLVAAQFAPNQKRDYWLIVFDILLGRPLDPELLASATRYEDNFNKVTDYLMSVLHPDLQSYLTHYAERYEIKMVTSTISEVIYEPSFCRSVVSIFSNRNLYTSLLLSNQLSELLPKFEEYEIGLTDISRAAKDLKWPYAGCVGLHARAAMHCPSLQGTTVIAETVEELPYVLPSLPDVKIVCRPASAAQALLMRRFYPALFT